MPSPEKKSIWKGKFQAKSTKHPPFKSKKTRSGGSDKSKKRSTGGVTKKPNKGSSPDKKKKKNSSRSSGKKAKKPPSPSGDALEAVEAVEEEEQGPPAPKPPPSQHALDRVQLLKLKRKKKSEFELSEDIATKSAVEQADWLWDNYKRAFPHVTDLERPALGLMSHHMATTTGTNCSLEETLKRVEPATWRQVFCHPPGPRCLSCLILSPAALGAISAIKQCPYFNGQAKILKLFAKHIKVAEQVEALQRGEHAVGAGTPHRILKLVSSGSGGGKEGGREEDGALKLDALKWVVLDVRRDAKQRTLLELPEVAGDFWALWCGEQHGLGKRVAQGMCKIVLFGDNGGGSDQ